LNKLIDSSVWTNIKWELKILETSKIQFNWLKPGRVFNYEKEAHLFDAYHNRSTAIRFWPHLKRHDRFLVGYIAHPKGAIWMFAWFWQSCLCFKGVFNSSIKDRNGVLVVKANHLDASEVCVYLRFQTALLEDFCFVDTHKMFEDFIRNFLSG
jgi:hypothetical protein